MELIDDFLKKVKENRNYNIENPDYKKLVDDWYGYDDQVYIQNNLNNKEIIFYEGWVSECWKAALLKPEYKGLKKIDIIKKIISERFPRIAHEFGFTIRNYYLLKENGKYIINIYPPISSDAESFLMDAKFTVKDLQSGFNEYNTQITWLT